MSTRCSLAYSDDFHLYQECFENDNVYLRLDSGNWSAALETAVIDWRDGDSTRPQLHIKMDVTMWRQIVDGWLKCYWSQHPEDDHRPFEINMDIVNKLAKKKENPEDETKV